MTQLLTLAAVLFGLGVSGISSPAVSDNSGWIGPRLHTIEWHDEGWTVHTEIDRMTDEKAHYVISYSKNILRSRYRSGYLLMGYACTDYVYFRANDLGFHVDDYRGSHRVQYSRIKFDGESPFDMSFIVWRDNRDGMTFRKFNRVNHQYENDTEFFLEKLKNATTMLLEVTISGTKGDLQIAEFDLTGFTAAVNQCAGSE